MSDGWIKLHRKFAEKSFYKKDSEAVHLWIHILLTATHNQIEETLGGKKIICLPGQFTTGRKQLSNATGISESKVERLLTKFEKIEHQIEQQKTTSNRLITILNWKDYQETEQPNEQRVNNEWTTSEHTTRMKECKNIKEGGKIAAFAATNDRKINFLKSLEAYIGTYSEEMIKKFSDYWCETNKSGSKMKWELEKTWETKLRLNTWENRELSFKKRTNSHTSTPTPKEVYYPRVDNEGRPIKQSAQ